MHSSALKPARHAIGTTQLLSIARFPGLICVLQLPCGLMPVPENSRGHVRALLLPHSQAASSKLYVMPTKFVWNKYVQNRIEIISSSSIHKYLHTEQTAERLCA